MAHRGRVCMVTSVHSPFDDRIFHKQALSLVGAGYQVALVAQHDVAETVRGVRIVALPISTGRFSRIVGGWRVFRLAFREKADVYHVHDPELLPVMVLLGLCTKSKVIYDIHENVKAQILTKSWIPNALRRFVSVGYQLVEKSSLPFIDYVVIADDSYASNYRGRQNVLSLRNYPKVDAGHACAEGGIRPPVLVYAGSITEARGVFQLVECVRLLRRASVDVELILVGGFSPPELSERVRMTVQEQGLVDNVHILGAVSHECVHVLVKGCSVGMAVLYDDPNYVDSLPTKLFEYMAAGIPVVASDFPRWREVVEDNACGIVVDPLDPASIASAVRYLMEHPEEAKMMGDNGRRAVVSKYTWGNECQKLLSLYAELLQEKPAWSNCAAGGL